MEGSEETLSKIERLVVTTQGSYGSTNLRHDIMNKKSSFINASTFFSSSIVWQDTKEIMFVELQHEAFKK